MKETKGTKPPAAPPAPPARATLHELTKKFPKWTDQDEYAIFRRNLDTRRFSPLWKNTLWSFRHAEWELVPKTEEDKPAFTPFTYPDTDEPLRTLYDKEGKLHPPVADVLQWYEQRKTRHSFFRDMRTRHRQRRKAISKDEQEESKDTETESGKVKEADAPIAYGFEMDMSIEEAQNIIGLEEEDARDRKKLTTAHRKLMLRNHPDRGGSPFMATKVNEAKELLARHTLSDVELRRKDDRRKKAAEEEAESMTKEAEETTEGKEGEDGKDKKKKDTADEEEGDVEEVDDVMMGLSEADIERKLGKNATEEVRGHAQDLAWLRNWGVDVPDIVGLMEGDPYVRTKKRKRKVKHHTKKKGAEKEDGEHEGEEETKAKGSEKKEGEEKVGEA
eukprot:TRINITY_DN9096_c0_g1_i1.p1 TRINITY_DN9096_c0_g1~~TRINITY_DN9096_c0_g1_i1.p1  ORF type:complete len:389 (-),score=113.16 TRINITY_DN9096_c0_g1_i1:32-1198(-)